MISTKSLLILLSIFSIFIIAPNSSIAEDAEVYPEQYDFGNVELGSTEITLVRISNISGSKLDYAVIRKAPVIDYSDRICHSNVIK